MRHTKLTFVLLAHVAYLLFFIVVSLLLISLKSILNFPFYLELGLWLGLAISFAGIIYRGVWPFFFKKGWFEPAPSDFAVLDFWKKFLKFMLAGPARFTVSEIWVYWWRTQLLVSFAITYMLYYTVAGVLFCFCSYVWLINYINVYPTTCLSCFLFIHASLTSLFILVQVPSLKSFLLDFIGKSAFNGIVGLNTGSKALATAVTTTAVGTMAAGVVQVVRNAQLDSQYKQEVATAIANNEATSKQLQVLINEDKLPADHPAVKALTANITNVNEIKRPQVHPGLFDYLFGRSAFAESHNYYDLVSLDVVISVLSFIPALAFFGGIIFKFLKSFSGSSKYAPIIRIGWKALLFVSIASLVLYAGYASFDWLIAGFISEFFSWLGACEITPTTVLLGQVCAALIYSLYTFVLVPIIGWFENLFFIHGSKLLTKSSPRR